MNGCGIALDPSPRLLILPLNIVVSDRRTAGVTEISVSINFLIMDLCLELCSFSTMSVTE